MIRSFSILSGLVEEASCKFGGANKKALEYTRALCDIVDTRVKSKEIGAINIEITDDKNLIMSDGNVSIMMRGMWA